MRLHHLFGTVAAVALSVLAVIKLASAEKTTQDACIDLRADNSLTSVVCFD